MLIADNVHKTYLVQRILIGSYCRLCKCPGQGRDHLMDSKSLYLCLDRAECDDDGYKEKKNYHPLAKKIQQYYWRIRVVKKDSIKGGQQSL